MLVLFNYHSIIRLSMPTIFIHKTNLLFKIEQLINLMIKNKYSINIVRIKAF